MATPGAGFGAIFFSGAFAGIFANDLDFLGLIEDVVKRCLRVRSQNVLDGTRKPREMSAV